MKLTRLAVALLLTAPAGLAQAAEATRSCEFNVKARCASGSASVTLKDGAVTKLSVDALYCGRERGAPGYRCEIDHTLGDDDSKWSDENGATIVANTAPFNDKAPDRVKVTVGKHISIDMEEAQSLGRCGAGAELPKAIVIQEKKKACRVFLNKAD